MSGVAIVTGAGSGIGFLVTQQLLKENYRVIALDKKQEALLQIQEKLKHPHLVSKLCDVTDQERVQAIFSEVGDQEGRIDVLFNGVGWMKIGGFLDLSEEDWDLSFQLNLKTVIYCVKSALPYMKYSDNPCIINLS